MKHLWSLTGKSINSIQVDSIDRLIQRAKGAHYVDVRVRINGKFEWHQADWIKHMRRRNPMFTWLKTMFCRHQWDQRYWGVKECGYLCMKCGRIQYRKGPGGPLPAGVSTPAHSASAEQK